MNGYIEWYYYPFYGAVLSSCLVYVRFLKEGRTIKNLCQGKGCVIIKNRVFFIYIFAFFLSGIFHVLFPVAAMEVPSGSYEVGTRIYEWIDENRLETYGNNAGNEYRKIKVQAWYPTRDVEGFQRLPWIPEGRVISRNLAKIFYFPPFMLDQSEEVLSNSYLDAPVYIEDTPFPIVVLSHGWSGFRTLHTDLGELLASHGYIVFGIDHTYGAPIVIFEDGKQVTIDGEALPPRENPIFLEFAEKLVNTYGNDISFVLDVLDEPQGKYMEKDIREGLNRNKIGLLGHSTGGGAGVEVAYRDSRIRGVIGLDPWVEPLSEKKVNMELKAPFLFLRSEEWKGQNNDENIMKILRCNKHGDLYQIMGTTHVDFTMIHMYSPITSVVGLTGSIERNRFEEIQEAFILGFFSEHLKEEGEEMDFSEGKYEEVYRVSFDENKD